MSCTLPHHRSVPTDSHTPRCTYLRWQRPVRLYRYTSHLAIAPDGGQALKAVVHIQTAQLEDVREGRSHVPSNGVLLVVSALAEAEVARLTRALRAEQHAHHADPGRLSGRGEKQDAKIDT